MTNELIVVEKIDKDVLFTQEGLLDKVLRGIRAKLDEFEPDVSTAAGRKKIASMSRKVSSSKTFLDQIRKDKIAKAKQEIDSANGMWKPARETLDQWRDETRKPLTDFEAEEQRKDDERIAGIRKRIERMHDSYWILNGTGTVEQLSAVIVELEATEVKPEIYFEFTAEAFQKRDEILAMAKQALETRIRLDAEEEERKKENERIAVERKKQEEEAAKLKAQQDIIDEQNRKLQAEKDALEAEKRKEQERKNREEFEKQAKLRAEKKAKEDAEYARLEKIRFDREALEDAERQKALLPDKEKLEAFSQFLMQGVNYPTVDSDNAKMVLKDAQIRIEAIAESIFDQTIRM